ncbi:hypothetical protein R5W23_002220 [Gemmata sp. JC673]|uniref:Uncharacterized protein n=1 Tax=Gemmata algarum TaxID=2975278 RepID=A0ABU5F0P5_9BACT|nr:hypothetical protein [Gemmata algarum]MDY3560971.1 hypothetical protein [Gemmata algarum]
MGAVHNIVHSAVEPARQLNARCDRPPVRIGAYDEIFWHGRPVLVGGDVSSTFCYRRFGRSEHPERVDKSWIPLLAGRFHPHWVELLGYQRFTRN